MKRLLASLAVLAESLGSMGDMEAAREVSGLLLRTAMDPFLAQWLRHKYERLVPLWEKRKKGSEKDEEAYAGAAKEQLDAALRKLEAGPPEDRLYFWFNMPAAESCPPCRARHGRIRSLRQWRAEGLPGPAVCQKARCGCSLLPLRPGGAVPAGIGRLNDDGDAAARLIGLRQDNSAENMQQGFALMPFWSGQGSLF
jgi:hypothetical protein